MQQINSHRYTGNKGAYGSYQNIINEFPLHQDFISGMGGSGAVEKRKLLAPGKNIVFELSEKTIAKHWPDSYGYQVRNADSVKWYATQKKNLCGTHRLFYWDAPYLLSERSSGKEYYEYEWTELQHIQFLELIANSKDLHAVSHYKCKLYDSYLSGWRVKQWRVMTHAGPRTEALYMNYERPLELHQYDYIGKDFTDRQRIKRRKETLIKQMEGMSLDERRIQLQELHSLMQIAKRYQGT